MIIYICNNLQYLATGTKRARCNQTTLFRWLHCLFKNFNLNQSRQLVETVYEICFEAQKKTKTVAESHLTCTYSQV